MKKIVLMMLFLLLPHTGIATPPPADKVFQLSSSVQDSNTLLLHWTIKSGYFLYKERIKFQMGSSSTFTMAPIAYPPADTFTNRQGQTYHIYRNNLSLPLSVLADEPGESLLDVKFQGCADDGFCYPPQQITLKLSFDNTRALFQVTEEPALEEAAIAQNNESQFDTVFSSNNLILIILGFVGFGLLLSFTPCVLPMVPVLSGLIVGHGQDITTRKAFLLSLSYVLSMSTTYAVIGAIVAMMGNNLQIVMQSPWSITVFSLIFVILALSMFNFYELRLPLSWQNTLAKATRSQAGGHYLGAAVMGCLSTLILSPCVTAPLMGALGYIAHTGNIIIGSVALFSLGLGMGLPLLLLGTSAGKLLPKAGQWMNEVKSFFGVLLLAVAIYLMERILPPPVAMMLWASLLIFTGVFLGALSRSITRLEKFNQGLGIISLAYGLLILIGASQGSSNPLQPLASIKANQSLGSHSQIDVVTSLPAVEKAIAQAGEKPVLLDFYADWCSSCKVIASTTLRDPAVLGQLRDFMVLKVDVTDNNARTKALLDHFNVVAPPTFIFFNAKGDELKNLRTIGDVSAEQFADKLKQAKKTR